MNKFGRGHANPHTPIFETIALLYIEQSVSGLTKLFDGDTRILFERIWSKHELKQRCRMSLQPVAVKQNYLISFLAIIMNSPENYVIVGKVTRTLDMSAVLVTLSDIPTKDHFGQD
jgi:hypothetical protein